VHASVVSFIVATVEDSENSTFLRQDGGNKTGLIRSFGRCRRSVGGSVKGFLSVCSSELEHRE
jgi:hypothetical protein